MAFSISSQRFSQYFLFENISQALSHTSSSDTLELEGLGSFQREDLCALRDLKVQVAPKKLRLLIERLDKSWFCLREYKQEDYTLLHLHVIAGREEDVAQDLQTIPVDTQDKHGFTALQLAAYLGCQRIVDQLLNVGASTSPGKNGSPLYLAVISEEVEVVRRLIQSGADVNYCDEDEATPLKIAVNQGRVDLVRILLAAGARVSAEHDKSLSALKIAAILHGKELVQMLLDAGADVNKLYEDNETIITLLKGRRPHLWKEVKQGIKEKATPDMITYSKFFLQTKLVAHIFHLRGKSASPLGEIEWERMSREPSIFAAAKCLTAFAKDSSSSLDERSACRLAQSLCFAAENHSAHEYLERIQIGEPAIILTGSRTHGVVILVWKSLFVLCDTADHVRPLSISRFDPEKLSDQTIRVLIDLKYKHSDPGKNMIREMLPDLLVLTQTENERLIENALAIRCQTVDNCAWAPAEGIIKAYFFLQKLVDCNFELTEPQSQELAYTTESIMSSYLEFFRRNLLKKYFFHEHDPLLVERAVSVS